MKAGIVKCLFGIFLSIFYLLPAEAEEWWERSGVCSFEDPNTCNPGYYCEIREDDEGNVLYATCQKDHCADMTCPTCCLNYTYEGRCQSCPTECSTQYSTDCTDVEPECPKTVGANGVTLKWKQRDRCLCLENFDTYFCGNMTVPCCQEKEKFCPPTEDPSDPSDPDAPSDPGCPRGRPCGPNPSDPDPSAPSAPSDPSEPDAPSDPGCPRGVPCGPNPSDPSDPSEPDAPSGPSEYGDPSDPGHPQCPPGVVCRVDDPSDPDQPDDPDGDPSTPGVVVSPSDPSGGTPGVGTPSDPSGSTPGGVIDGNPGGGGLPTRIKRIPLIGQ